MNDDFGIEGNDREEALTERERYFGETCVDVEDRLIGCDDSIFGGVLGEGIRDLWRAVRNDYAALNYLARVHAERTGEPARTIQEDGIIAVSEIARETLLGSGRLPVEIHERFERRRNGSSGATPESYVPEREILSLEDF